MYFVSLPDIFSSLIRSPNCLVTPVSFASFAPVTVSSYDTMIRPSGPVCHAVPGIVASSLSVDVIAAADSVDGLTGAAEACVARSPAAASPAAARIAVVRRNGDRFIGFSLLTMRTPSGRGVLDFNRVQSYPPIPLSIQAISQSRGNLRSVRALRTCDQ